MPSSSSKNLICLAEIVGVHGVKGMLKLKVFSDNPDSLTDYAPLYDADLTKEFHFTSLQPHQNIYLATLDSIKDRTAAEKLKGTKLYVPRDRLPEIKSESTFYHSDLVGMTAKDLSGNILGKVQGIANFGSCDLLDIKPAKGASFYVPFTDAIVPKIDMTARELTIDPPPGLLD